MMDSIEASAKAQTVLGQLLEHPRLGRYIDSSLEIPRGFRGSGEIRLIILGQDPTVKNERSRQTIRCVLNLDSRGNLWNYLSQVCRELGIELSRNVYATNLLKNFLVAPPTQIKEIDVFQEALPFWLPLLKEELAEFPSVPVLALGEPLLTLLVRDPGKARVRDYWGYTTGWKTRAQGPFSCLAPQENILGRTVFPFPHQPSIRKTFYRDRLLDYCAFTRQAIG
jgi:uracil-DNA glycosylase